MLQSSQSPPVSSGRGGRAFGRGLDQPSVVQQSHHPLSCQKSAELQDDAGEGVSAGRLAVHLHRGGETGVRVRQTGDSQLNKQNDGRQTGGKCGKTEWETGIETGGVADRVGGRK